MPKRVMIVEDNELNMKLFRDLIEACGYETIQTRNGMEAMELARTEEMAGGHGVLLRQALAHLGFPV